ncbi:MAG TPA: lipid-A-disaccharide synthase N-terminal domain-containing protein [Candidatus Ozemobacteraceae bacterium]|nr:lipid-A-disaccharide synthase N-terminal domain-containing protein [Candidatus Ozemobacteraceae bacterium]
MKLEFWLLLGLFGQFMFFMRFFMQWVESERQKKSVIPVSFWYLSLAGSAILAIYAVHIKDPVFILGQSLGFFIYIRNLMLIKKERKSNDGSDPTTA